MSNFLYYFELRSKKASWELFQKKHETVLESFKTENNQGNGIITPLKARYIEKEITLYIIHDGFSSDSFMNKGLNSSLFINFLKRRQKISLFDLCFKINLVDHDPMKEVSIPSISSEIKLNEIENTLLENRMYKIKHI